MMKQLYILLVLLLAAPALAQQYSYDEKISIRSGGPSGILDEDADGTSYNVAAPNDLFYVGSEEYFGPRNAIIPATARINYRIRESNNPVGGAYTQLTVSELTNTGDSWFYRGAAGSGCNCPLNIDLYNAAPGNGTFTLETFISVQQTNGNLFNGKPQAIVFTVSGKVAQPVTLVSFSARKDNTAVALTWTTASERNNSYFTVERSADLLTWQQVAYREGQGNSTAARTYTARDLTPPRGTSYYRLKQVDADGTVTTFKPQPVTMDLNPAVTVLPTVADRELTIAGIESAIELRIYDLRGMLYRQYNLQTATTLDLSTLQSGIYIVRTTDETTNRAQRILVQH